MLADEYTRELWFDAKARYDAAHWPFNRPIHVPLRNLARPDGMFVFPLEPEDFSKPMEPQKVTFEQTLFRVNDPPRARLYLVKADSKIVEAVLISDDGLWVQDVTAEYADMAERKAREE